MAQNNQINIPTPFPVNKGGTGVTSVTTSPTATSWAGWDANKNLSATGFIPGYTTTVTSGSPVVLTVGSNQQQYFTGSTAQTLTMPVTSTLVVGQYWSVINNSSAVVTIQSSGANTILALPANSETVVTCVTASGTTAASWTTSPAVSGSGTVNSGLINQLAWYASSGTTVSGLSTANSGILVTSAGGVPSISSTLPAFTTSSITFNPTTSGIVGTTAADNASAGKVGELITSNIAFASAVSLSNGIDANVTSISLTAGDWDVIGNINTQFSVSASYVDIWCSITSATLPDGSLLNSMNMTASTIVNYGATTPFLRVNVSSSTTVYLSCQASFGIGTGKAYGSIFARRVR